jgi:TldD protein
MIEAGYEFPTGFLPVKDTRSKTVNHRRLRELLTIVMLGAVCAGPAVAADEKLPDSDVLMRALVDELERSMTLQIEDLEQPYFVQFDADDSLSYQFSAEYGALTGSERDRTRRFRCQVRVGSYELDSTNFVEGRSFFRGRGSGRGGGGQASLPLDDDYLALRQAIWRAADDGYKDAVETLTRKRAYMRDKNIAERPDDFSRAEAVAHTEPTAVLSFDQAGWQENLERISAHFKKYAQVQDAAVRLAVGASNSYVVNSEGTRLRVADTGALLIITAQVQAEDGMRLSGGRTYEGESTADFPPVTQILSDIDELVADLTAVMEAPLLDFYSGPVLFDDTSAAQLFQAMLADGVVGRPDPVGEQRRGPWERRSLENKLGTRILPNSFQVWDDPRDDRYEGKVLAGHYDYDDEGVPAQRVHIVADGELQAMCLSRSPIKELSGSNGHGRRPPGGGDASASIACLFVKDNEGIPDDELKAALIEAARDAGLEYGVRIKSLKSLGITSTQADLVSMLMRRMRGGRGGGGTSLGDPVVAYKVYVEDGREEPFRGCGFGAFRVTELKRIAAAGDTPHVYNYISLGMGGASPPATIVAPPVLFEELELSRIEEEHDKLPILKAPAFR